MVGWINTFELFIFPSFAVKLKNQWPIVNLELYQIQLKPQTEHCMAAFLGIRIIFSHADSISHSFAAITRDLIPSAIESPRGYVISFLYLSLLCFLN